jgi:hypothetical protein
MQSQSQPVVYGNVKNAYTKDSLYCLYLDEGKVHKFPLCNIFRIEEDYKHPMERNEKGTL